MRKLIIGISGKAEHGKTAAAAIIKERAENHGLFAGVFEISKLIYDHCVSRGLMPEGLQRVDLSNEQVKMLVDEGSAMRAISPEYWTNLIMEQIDEADVDVAITPNLRFPPEGNAVRNAGGFILRVNRLNRDGSPFVSMTRDPNHPCETSLDTWPSDLYVTNVTGHEHLYDMVISAYFDYMLEMHEETL